MNSSEPIAASTEASGTSIEAAAPNGPAVGAPEVPARKPERLLRLPAVESLTALKKSSIYAGMKARTFPPCVRLSARAVAWRESDIAAWQAQRLQTGGGHD